MRKLRGAAVVATMVGGVGMLGAGMASAQDGGQVPGTTVICNYEAPRNNGTTQSGLININGPLLGGGSAESTGVQQICGIDNDNNTNRSGPATGGAGGNGTISVPLVDGLLDGVL